MKKFIKSFNERCHCKIVAESNLIAASLRGKATAAEAIQKTAPQLKSFRRLGFNPTSINGGIIKLPAFSLVEMLMTLLVASLLMAALAPVITKKMNENINVSGNVNRASNFKIFQVEDCEIKDNNTAECSFIVPEGVTVMDIYLQGGGGGGAGATAGVNETCSLNSLNGNTSANKNVCKMTDFIKNVTDPGLYSSWDRTTQTRSVINAEIVPGIKDFNAILIASGGGGGGAVGRVDCYDDNYKYLTAAQNGGTAACVTKYNVGDTYLGGPTATVEGNSVVPAGTSCVSSACCWIGNGAGITGNKAYCTDSYGKEGDSNYISYSGCTRSACTWDAANNACNQYAGGGLQAGQWRLPTQNEMSAWVNNVADVNHNKGIDGLMICNDNDVVSGNVNCENTAACIGSGDDGCHSYDLWTGTSYENETLGWYHNGWFAGNSANIQQHPPNRAFGARCISQNTSLYGWKSFSGGGGGSGAVAHVYSSSSFFNDFLKSNTGKSLHFYSRSINEGAPAASFGATSSKAGEHSNDSVGIHLHIKSYASDFTDVVISVPAGISGSGGKVLKPGQNGSAPYGDCGTTLSWIRGTDYSCVQGKPGFTGTYTNGGDGGSITYNLIDGTVHTCNGSGGSRISGEQNGGKPSCYGAGGGGAASASTGNGRGGDGGDSYFEAQYKVVRYGAAGGGGGGGAYVYKKAVNVVPGETIKIVVGIGGKGGIGGSKDYELLKGGDGTATKVIIKSKEFIAEGGKGGNYGNDDNILPVGGTGGKGGSGSPFNASIFKGKDGSNGEYKEENSISTGGRGGNSGSGGIGSCGGLYSDDECSNPVSVNAAPVSILSDAVITALLNDKKAPAGGGGGGGAFKGIGDNVSFGNGAQGLNGYVFLDWRNY